MTDHVIAPDLITQADRDAAIDFATRYLYPNSSGVRKALAQSFAKHRLEATANAEPVADKAELAALIHRYYMREIGQLMHQAEHWMENAHPFAVHHRVMKSDAYFQVANLFDPAQRDLGWKCPFERMEDWLKLAENWEVGSYPPSVDLHKFRDPKHVVALANPAITEALKEAREALTFFASVADEYDDSEDDSFEVWQDAGPVRNIRQSFRLEHYRRARQALSRLGEGGVNG